MNEFKGTRGPYGIWHNPSNPQQWIVYADHETLVYQVGGEERAEANAHLLAASWDLLEAAQASLLEFEASHQVMILNSNRGMKEATIIPTLRAAIAKALNQ